ncbi:tetratricopeptide repeat protein [bacterium]|nr:tetratricopeptide repeat protein [bacterium]
MAQQDAVLLEAKAALEAGDDVQAEALLAGRTDRRATLLRASIRCGRGEHLEAVRLLKTVIAEKETAQAYYRLGMCWEHLGQWDGAEKALRRAVLLDPRHTDAFIRLGTALYQLDRSHEAMRAYEQALVNDPKALLARYQLAQLCTEAGDFKRALTQLHVLQGLKPDYDRTRRLQAAIFLKLGDHRQALVELCWLAEKGHADAWCFGAMGRAYRAIGEKLQALRAYEFALRLEPSLDEETLEAASLNEELEQYEAALALYRALVSDPQWGERARAAVKRLERRLATLAPDATPTELAPFEGFEPPPTQQPETKPLGKAPGLRTVPLAPAEEPDVEEDLLAIVKRNLGEIADGRLDAVRRLGEEVLSRLPLEGLKQRLPKELARLQELKQRFQRREGDR